jgi:hypothetical protein
MPAPTPTFNQSAVDNLLKPTPDVFKPPITTGGVNFEVPVSGHGNIDFPYSYSKNKTPDNPIGDNLKALFNSGPTEKFMTSTIKYNADAINAARYVTSPDYLKLGISLNGDNEENYGQNQSWSEVLSNGVKGMGKLAANGFVDGWKQWGRTADALIHWDWNKLHGDAESMLELDNKLKDIMNSNAIYATKQGTDTFWNRQTFGNFLQQSGFAVGAGVQMLSEQIITKAIEAGLTATGIGAGAAAELELVTDVKSAATVGRIASFFNKGKEFFNASKAMKNLKKLGDVWTDENVIKKFATSLGERIPGVDIAMDISKTYKTGVEAGLSGTQLAGDIAKVGLGGLKRTMSEANFAFSEARMEAAGTFSDLYNQMQDDHFKRTGTFAQGDELQNMQNTAMKAADKNFNFNSAVLAVSNRIMFDNVFKNSKITSKILSQFGEDVGERGFKVLGKINGRSTSQYYTGSVFKNYKTIAADFGTTKARTVLAKSIMKPALKFEATEGLQELLQEGSAEYYKDYYLNSYKASYNPDIEVSSEKSLDKAISSQMNMQGLKTFASGALTGMLLHGPTVLISKGGSKLGEKITDAYRTKDLTEEKKEEYFKNKQESKDELKNYYNEFNAIAKDPSTFFSESIKNFNVQKEGSSALDEAAKLGDKFAYENIRTDMLHKMVSQAVRNNTHEALADTLREYGKHMSKEEFEQAFVGLDYSSDNKKSTADYTEKVATSIESYAKIYNKLQDKYGSRVNPNRYAIGSNDFYREASKKQVLNNMIDVIAGNEFKSIDALERSLNLYTKATTHKTLGSSLASAYNILGSQENVNKEKSLLDFEIKSKKEQLKSDDISLESKSKLQIEIDLKEKQKKSLEDWLNTKDELIDETKVTKSYDAFKTYLELKNKEFGKTDAVNVNEIEDLFLDFNDYIKLNKKNQSHVDAINMLSNPDYFDQVYTRMEQGAELAYFQLLHDAAEEQIKAGLVKPDEHFIVEANGRYGVFTPTGQIVSITDNIDEARKVKDELDKELKQTKEGEALKKEGKETENKKFVEIETIGKDGKPYKVTLIEGNDFITESEPVKRVIPSSGKVITTYDQDIIKIDSLDLDNKTVTVTVNNDTESITYSLDEFAKLSGRLWNLNTIDPEAALFFRNRDRVIVIKVNKDNGLLHRIDGDNFKKDYSKNSEEVFAMIKYKQDPNNPGSKILFFDYKTKNGKYYSVPFDLNYYNKYGVKTDKKYLLRVAPTVEQYIKEKTEQRKLEVYNKQVKIFELLIKEQEEKSGPREQRKRKIQEELDNINKDLDEAKKLFEEADEEIDSITSGRKKISQKQKRKVATLKEQINKYQERLKSLKETSALLNAEKVEIEKELEELNKVSETYYKALAEITTSQTPYLRSGESQTIYGEEQEELEKLESNRPVDYIPVNDFDTVINSLNLEKNEIKNQLKVVEDTIKRVEKLISRFIKYDDIIKAIVGIDPTDTKSKKDLQTALVKLKLKEQNKIESDNEKIELINNLLSGLNTRFKGFENQVFGREIVETIGFVNLFDIAQKEKEKLEDQLNFVSKEIEQISEGQEFVQNKILPISEKIKYLKNIEKILLEGQAKLESLNLIEKSKKIVKAPTVEAAQEFSDYNDVMSFDEVIPGDNSEDDIIIMDFDKVLFTNGLYKSAGRHYSGPQAQKENVAVSPEQDRFFTFTSNVIVANKNYFFVPITKDNDKYGIIQKSYVDAKGNTVEVKDDVKLVVTKKVGDNYIPVDKYGNVLAEDQQTKDNIVFNSMVNTVELMQDDVNEAVKWLKSDANKTFTISENKLQPDGSYKKIPYTDKEIIDEIESFKKFKNEIIKNIKEGKKAGPLKITRKSNGKQRRVPLDVTTGTPQELPLQGRLIEENSDFSEFGELKHPDGSIIKLTVSTKNNGLASNIKTGRLVMHKGDTFYQVYNRRITDEEKDNVFDVILAILPMMGRRYLTEDRKRQLAELYENKIITLDRFTELRKELTEEEQTQFDFGIKYLMNTIYWSQPKEGGKIGNKQFYIKGDSLYVGEKAYEFETNGNLNLQNIIKFKDEIMNLVTKDKNGNEIVGNMFHSVNNSLINKKNISFQTIKVVDGKIVKDKKFKNYLEYLLSNKNGRTPIVYTNIVEYNKDEPQLANSYLSYSRPKEENIVPPKINEKKETTATESLEEINLDLLNLPQNEKILIRKKFGKNKKTVDFYGVWDGENFKIEKAYNVTDDTDVTDTILEKVPNTITEAIKNIKEYSFSTDSSIKKIYNDLMTDFINVFKVSEQKQGSTNQTNKSVIKSDIEKLIRMGKIEFVDDTTNAKC